MFVHRHPAIGMTSQSLSSSKGADELREVGHVDAIARKNNLKVLGIVI
jgi:hypothetical protein